MSPQATQAADNEPTDHFDEEVVRKAVQAIEDTDPGHYDEIDLFGTLEPAPIRSDEVPFDDEDEAESAPLGLLVLLASAAAFAFVVAAAAVVGSVVWLGSTLAEEPQQDVVVAPTETQLVGQEATNAHIDAVLDDPANAPAEVAAPTFELRTVPVQFAFDSWQASIERTALSTLVSDIQGDLDAARSADGQGKLVLTGHTDSRGSEAANELMGLGRAWAVQVIVVREGLEGEIELVGAGESEPIASNATAEGRAANRRVTAEVFAPIPLLSAVLAQD